MNISPSTPRFECRLAMPEDAYSILSCHRDAILKKAADHYSPEVLTAWAPDPADSLRVHALSLEVQDPYLIFMVAADLETGQILGFISIEPAREELRGLYTISSSYKGVGKALWMAGRAECLSRGCKSLHMDASVNAEGFYNRMGFESLEYGTHILESGHSMAGVRMRITLMEIG